MKINEIGSQTDPLKFDDELPLFLEELKKQYGKDSIKYKRACKIIKTFFHYDDPETAIQSIKQQLATLDDKIFIWNRLKK